MNNQKQQTGEGDAPRIQPGENWFDVACRLQAQRDELLAACKELTGFTFTDYQHQVALQILVKIKRRAILAIAKSEGSAQ